MCLTIIGDQAQTNTMEGEMVNGDTVVVSSNDPTILNSKDRISVKGRLRPITYVYEFYVICVSLYNI